MPPRFGPRLRAIALMLSASLALVAFAPTPVAEAGDPAPLQSTAVTRNLTLKPSQATYTDKSSAKRNFASAKTMLASKSRYATYLRFAKPSLESNETIVGATLSFYVSSLTGKKKANIDVTPVKSGWTAKKVTHKVRPASLGERINSTTAAKAKKRVSIKLNAVAAADYLRSGAAFAISNRLASTTVKITRTGSKAPTLILTIVRTDVTARASASSPTPTPEPTAAPKPSPSPAPTTATPTTAPRQTPEPTSSPSTATSSGKLVFAHYFPPYPISIDNADPATDYYQRHYLQASGENGKFASIGGLLRDRPHPRKALSGNWKLADLRSEIRQAIDAGIDGFAVDILNLTGSNWDRTVMLLTAAAEESPTFKIMLQPDMTTSPGSASAADLAAAMAKLAVHPSVYRLKDGSVVISPFKTEQKSPAHWAEVLRIMSTTHKIKATLLPLFLDANKMPDYASISAGFGNWGVRDAKLTAAGTNYAAKAHNLGKLWMQPIGVQDVRPNQKLYEESANTETLRATWGRAINDDADLALLVTWNDYSEGTSFAPSVGHGSSFADINAYYADRFRTGSAPAITSDVAYISHRVHRVATLPSYSDVMVHWPGSGRTAPRDTVEVLTFLKAESTVQVTVGTKQYSYTAPKGISAKLFDLADGYSSVTVQRSGATVATVKTKRPVVRSITQQDLAYYAVSSAD